MSRYEVQVQTRLGPAKLDVLGCDYCYDEAQIELAVAWVEVRMRFSGVKVLSQMPPESHFCSQAHLVSYLTEGPREMGPLSG